MAITPETNIKLLKCPLTLSNKNQINFANKTAQYNYFNSLEKIEIDECSYQRKENIIRFPEHIDTILGFNYCMYQNSNYTNKWFYAYITNMEYVNDNCTNITIATDVWQTWHFDINFKDSFVEREHTNDDTVGKNLIDENLQLGEYVVNKINRWLNDTGDGEIFVPDNLVIVLGATENNEGNNQGGVQTDGIYAGLRYYIFHNNSEGISDLNDWLTQYEEGGKSEAVKCIFMLPEILTTGADREDHLYSGGNNVIRRYINGENTSLNKNINLQNTTIDGYTPKNKKLLTYPYQYLLVSNNSGTDVIYRLEDFYNSDKVIQNPSFRIESCMTVSGSIRMIPLNFKGASENDNEGINMGKFPACNWDTDVFTNWLTQNGVNIGLQVAGAGISMATSIATGNPIGIASSALSIGDTLGEIYKESKIPPQANGNINSGDVVTASGKNDFIFYNMSIKAEFAKIIDDYFTMFGYKTNKVKIPNLTGRQNWNYIKTIDCNILGDIPQMDLQSIKELFDNGLTIWHSPSTFLDYSQNNNII